jgi:hypothetical protein
MKRSNHDSQGSLALHSQQIALDVCHSQRKAGSFFTGLQKM